MPDAPPPTVDTAKIDEHPRLKRLIARLCGCEEREFVLRVVQPSLVGLIDGTVSTLAPIFAAATSSNSRTALLVGIATALGRSRFLRVSLRSSLVAVTLGGAIVAAIGVGIGSA